MFDRNLMRLEGMRAVLGGLVLLALMQAACIIGQAYYISLGVVLLWGGEDLANAAPAIAAFLCCFSLLQLLRFGQDTMLDRFSLTLAGRLREGLLAKTFDQTSMLAARIGTADIATTLTEGVDEVQTYARIIPPKLVGMAAISFPILATAFILDWVSGAILAVMFPVIIFFMVLLGRQASDRAARQYSAYTRLSNRFIDTLRGLDVITAFGTTKREETSVYTYSEKLRRATIRTISAATLSSAVLDLCSTFGVAAVALMLAFRLMDGSIDFSVALFALVLAPEFFSPIRAFASDFHASLDGKNALAHVLELIEMPDEAPCGNPRENNDAGNSPESLLAGAWTGASTLELRGVTFAHDASQDPIGPIDMHVHGIEHIAIVGRSGAGKSTLASLLAGFIVPDKGEIILNGTPTCLANPSWRAHVRYIPQHPYVFRASIADNVRLYAPAASEDEVVRAIRAVGLDGLVDDLPDGIETLVGEGARGLSGGQAHRIALARILLDDDARVLVFDEPTANLDIETELDLKGPMIEAMRGKLVFFATHRLHWLDDLDRVVLVDADAPAEVLS